LTTTDQAFLIVSRCTESNLTAKRIRTVSEGYPKEDHDKPEPKYSVKISVKKIKNS